MTDTIFNLEKNVVFSLEKLVPGIKDWYIGVDWERFKNWLAA